MRKWLFGLLLITTLLPLLAWLSLPWTGQYLLREWLLEQGFSAPALTFGHPSWQAFDIDHIAVSRQQDGQTLSLEAQNIQLSFDPVALLRGQLKELRVDKVHLALEGTATANRQATETTDSHFDLSTLQLDQLFRFAPSNRLVVAQLQLDVRLDEQQHWSARGNIDLEPELLQTRLALQYQQQPLGYLDATLDPDFQLSLGLSHNQAVVTQGQYRLEPGAKQWLVEAHQSLNLNAAKAWAPLTGLTLPADIQPLSGELGIDTRVRLPVQLPLQPDALLQTLELDYRLKGQLHHSEHESFTAATLQLDTQGTLSQLQLKSRFNDTLLQIQQPLDYPLSSELKLNGSLDLNLSNLSSSFDGVIASAQLPAPLNLKANVDLSKPHGRINFNLPAFPLQQTMSLYASLLPASLKPLQIQSGSAEVSGWLAINYKDWHLKASPRLSDLSLSWDETTQVQGVSLTTDLELNQSLNLTGQGSLDVQQTDSGIRIYGPRVDFKLNGQLPEEIQLSLSPFSLSVLDGIIALPALTFNPLHPTIDTRVAVAALDLQDILALYPQEGLYGSGMLGGELPIRIDGDRVEINNGQLLSSAEGGVIRYQPTPEIALMGQQNPGVKMALNALTDLRFELLDLGFDYQPDGDAFFRARLKGYNPDWQQGRPIDLNLNIEENLLDLWRTLQLSNQVTDTIDRRFQR